MLRADAVVFGAQFLGELRLVRLTDEIADDGHGAAGVEDVDDRLAVAGRDLHGGVRLARGRAADEQRQLYTLPFHLAGDVHHLVQRWRDESAQADDVHVQFAGGGENFFARHHHAEVNDLVVVAGEDDADDVFADVMHVALDGGHEDFAGVLVGRAAQLLLLLHERHEIRHGFFHHARGLDDLRQKHFARAEQIADDVHAGHERAFDDLQRLREFLPRFLNVRVNEINNALHERVREAFLDRAFAPFVLDDFGLALLFHRLGELDEPLGGVGFAIEENIFDQLQKFLRDFLIDREHSGVDDAHVEAGFDGVIQERAVHGLAHGVVAAERERDVADAAADFRVRQVFLDPLGGADEIHGVIRVFLHARADGEDVGIENDVLRREADFLDEQIVGALADFRAALEGIGLTLFIERHHDDRRAVAQDEFRLREKLLLAFLERDGIDDAFALKTFQTSFEDFPFRGVHHDRHFADVRLGGDEVEEARHRGHAVNHPFVHAHVNDLRAVLDLLARDGDGGLVFAGLDELRELGRPRDVRALADVQEIGLRGDGQCVETAQAQVGFNRRNFARRQAFDGIGDGLDVGRRGAAAAADDVEPAVLRPLAELRGERFGCFGKAGGQERIRQAGVRIRAHVDRREAGEFLDERAQFLRAERAVHADAQERDVRNGIPKRFDGLAGDASVAAGLDERDGGEDRDNATLGFGLWTLDFRIGQGDDAAFVVDFLDGEECGAGVERVEDGFHQQHVRAAVEHAVDLFAVGRDEFIVGAAACAGVVDVGGDGGCFGRWPDGAGDETDAARLCLLDGIGCAAGAFCAGLGEFVGEGFHAVIRERDGLRVEGVGLDDVRAGFEVLAVDFLDDGGLGDVEQVVEALEVLVPVGEARAAIIRLLQLVTLDHRAHRAVNDDDAFTEQALQFQCSV